MAKIYDGGYNYTNLTKAYQRFPTEKQLKLVEDLKTTCDRVGIDISDMDISTKTKNEARQTIRKLYSILTGNGYDGYGNPIKIYQSTDSEIPST